jgi:hypothetical protein
VSVLRHGDMVLPCGFFKKNIKPTANERRAARKKSQPRSFQ